MLAAFRVANFSIDFLIDTGSSISLIPFSLSKLLSCVLSSSSIYLKAADGRSIAVHGQTHLKLSNSSLRRSFIWVFVVADVSKPILGADFLSNFHINVNCSERAIVDTNTKFCAPCISKLVPEYLACSVKFPENFPAFVPPLFEKYPALLMPEQIDYSVCVQGPSVQHTIDTGSARPVFARARQLPPNKYDIAKKEFDFMLAADILRPSKSDWASPLHLVRKKDGQSWRPCGDFRQLNAITKKDRYPLPHINSSIDRFHGKNIYSKLDVVKAYFHIPVAPEDVKKTAVITPFGLFEFTRMPFGLCNAPQTFQRFMDSIFRDLPFVFVYIDDILIASTNLDDHKIHLETVMKRLCDNKLHVALEKCVFAVPKVDFLGYSISPDGIVPLANNVEAINNYELPIDYAALRRFLGMIGFYRRFMPSFSDTAEPLYQLLASCNGKNVRLLWTDDTRRSFEQLKENLNKAVQLHFTDPRSDTFHLVTDASNYAIGAALHQSVGNELRPVAFFSKRLSTSQRSYSAFDRELLAVYLAVVHFKPVIEGRTVTVFTDHKPLVNAFYSQTPPKSDRQQRHLSYISEYVCSFEYIRGSENMVADALSRAETDQTTCSLDLMLPALSTISTAQKDDEEIEEYKEKLKSFPTADKQLLWCDTTLLYPRPFVPREHRMAIFNQLHGLSHPGVKGSTQLVTERYFWPDMRRNIKEWVRECINCQRSKVFKHNKTQVQQMQFPASDRFHTVHLDIVGPLKPSKDTLSLYPSEMRYLVTMIDRATRWFEVVPVSNITAETIADVFLTAWVSRFGVPLHIVTDRGRQFESELMSHLSSLIGFHRLRTTAYHPQSNGMVERFHRTLKNALKARPDDWLIALPSVLLALRCLPNEHGISPFTAVTGASPLMPHTFFSASSTRSALRMPELVLRLAQCMSDIDFSSLSKGVHHTPDRLLHSVVLNKGDFVFVRIDRVRRPLESPYQGPFEVLDCTDKIVKIKMPNDEVSVVTRDRVKLAHIRKSVVRSKPLANPSSDIIKQPSDALSEQQQSSKRAQRRVRFAK